MMRGMENDPRRDPAFLAAYGEVVAALRVERHLDRHRLAQAAEISYSYLSGIETGQKLPSPRVEAAITNALGTTPAELLERVNGVATSRIGNAPMRGSGGGVAGTRDPSRIGEWDDEPAALSPSGALAELRVLLPTMSPQDAATIVGLARDLAHQAAPLGDRTLQGVSADPKIRDLRTSAYLAFWSEYVTKVTNRGLDWVRGRAPGPRSHFTTTSQIKGVSLSASFARDRLLRHALYLNRGSRDANLELFHDLASERSAIEAAYGRELQFEDPGPGRRAVRIAEYRSGHIKRTDEHGDYIEWFIDAGLRMRRAVGVFVEYFPSE